MPLSNAKIQEAIVKVMIEDEEGSITDANNVTADAFSHASSSQRENADTIFTSEKLDKSDELVDAINKLTINDAGYELKKTTASDAQDDIMSNPDTVTHTSNEFLEKTLLSCGPLEKSPYRPCRRT